MITMAWGFSVLGWFRMDFHFCCVSPRMLMVWQLKGLVCWVVVVFFFSWGGFSLSLCFCGVLDSSFFVVFVGVYFHAVGRGRWVGWGLRRWGGYWRSGGRVGGW